MSKTITTLLLLQLTTRTHGSDTCTCYIRVMHVGSWLLALDTPATSFLQLQLVTYHICQFCGSSGEIRDRDDTTIFGSLPDLSVHTLGLYRTYVRTFPLQSYCTTYRTLQVQYVLYLFLGK